MRKSQGHEMRMNNLKGTSNAHAVDQPNKDNKDSKKRKSSDPNKDNKNKTKSKVFFVMCVADMGIMFKIINIANRQHKKLK